MVGCPPRPGCLPERTPGSRTRQAQRRRRPLRCGFVWRARGPPCSQDAAPPSARALSLGERRRCPTVWTHPQACLLPSRRPPAAVPGLLTRQHQPTPGRWPCLIAADGGTRRGREASSNEPGTHGPFSGEPSESGPLRTSSVRVAAVVTQCCIRRIVLALPLPAF